jgi:hypothetical protein
MSACLSTCGGGILLAAIVFTVGQTSLCGVRRKRELIVLLDQGHRRIDLRLDIEEYKQ